MRVKPGPEVAVMALSPPRVPPEQAPPLTIPFGPLRPRRHQLFAHSGLYDRHDSPLASSLVSCSAAVVSSSATDTCRLPTGSGTSLGPTWMQKSGQIW